MNTLRDVLVETVRDLYSAESQAVKALPRLAKAATHPQLKEAFTQHLEETRKQVERLDQVVELLQCKGKGKTCVAMKGLVEEAQEVIANKGSPIPTDAALICAAQKQEHYEIAAYGSAATFAKVLKLDEVAELLGQTLAEEKAADEKLTQVAESGLNEQAADEDGDEGEDGGDEEAAEAPPAKPKKAPAAKKPAAKAKKGG